MQASLLTTLLLPLALGVIMFGLGLGLTLDDFRRVALYPRAVLIGLALQIGVLPWAALGLALLFRLPPELAVGLMLLAASPGGATANIYSHIARGDVALNITLTAVNSVLCLVTLPVILNLSLEFFLGAGQYVPPPTRKIVEVALIILLPVSIGMLVRAFASGFASRMEKPIRLLSVIVLVLLIIAAVAGTWDTLLAYFAAVGIACLLFNLVSMGAGYAAPRALKLPRRQAIAIAMEIGIHNGTLAIFIALSVLGNATMSAPAAVYSLLMFFTAAAFAAWLNRPGARDANAAA
ncbi:bile acid:sodium symporter family protein [Luteimonas fraxinea]|uniref:Bile acid:sodium symporter family protein n=1 Tax=Luteimonas fraxinea TaxID=2901869 RepID=A0ABS8UIF7_9GAMM|nr:bile acid:sodium symporter family protein [Luteimonas fraxinea]MCD9098463.1 bile acid:sodium symporter family protein [Luteimonas fraxinea]MCD9127196.1 bile acid:sodium symporter family protein [Luteimonas fraxinea]UHH10574.1 bile acid:sodium symporter family protein [Luteimonas fraxinea]